MKNSTFSPFDSTGLFPILLQKENRRLEIAVLESGLWSPSGEIMSRDWVLLVWVPFCGFIHLSNKYSRCYLRESLWNWFWLPPSRSTASSRMSRLPVDDLSTVSHICEHSAARPPQKAQLTTPWRKGPRGGLHRGGDFTEEGFTEEEELGF